jgi:hypothetical protein
MIGSVAFAALLVAVPTAGESAQPSSPGASPQVRREHRGDVEMPDVEVPEIDIPEIHLPDIRIPEIRIPKIHIPHLHLPVADLDALRDRRLALRERDEDEDADEPRERSRDRDASERDRWPRHRFEPPRWSSRSSDEEDSRGEPTSRASGRNGSATLAVKGPITFRLRVQSGDVEVVPTTRSQVAVTLSGIATTGEVQLVQFGDRVEVELDGRRSLRRGNLRVELPKGSGLEFESSSGDVSVQDVGGDVRLRTMSGDVKVKGARNVDLESISGDATVDATGSRVRLHLVSGTAFATTTDPAVQLAFQSASGNLEWAGVCAKGCHLMAETVSGDIKLQPDAARSSFALSYSSHSGDLRDELNLDVKRSPKRKHGGMGGWVEALYGKGEGLIECDAFSGDVVLRKK